jgi:hypothetical protein
MNQYEKLIEYIINEQDDRARELFHQIVVEKSREIYENLIDEEGVDEELGEVTGLVDEIEADQEGMVEADDEMDMDSDMEMDAEMPGDDMGEPGDDMDDMGGEEGEGELEDRVMDLEAALDELKAEFDALMSDEMNEPEHADMEMPKEEGMDPAMVREYVDKVAAPANAEGHTVGTGASDKPGTNAKSIVAGKNDMGGSSANIVKGGAEQAADGKPVPQPNNQYAKGKGNMPHAGQYENVPGAKTKGYTAKAGAKHNEGSTTDGGVPVQKHSPVAK